MKSTTIVTVSMTTATALSVALSMTSSCPNYSAALSLLMLQAGTASAYVLPKLPWSEESFTKKVKEIVGRNQDNDKAAEANHVARDSQWGGKGRGNGNKSGHKWHGWRPPPPYNTNGSCHGGSWHGHKPPSGGKGGGWQNMPNFPGHGGSNESHPCPGWGPMPTGTSYPTQTTTDTTSTYTTPVDTATVTSTDTTTNFFDTTTSTDTTTSFLDTTTSTDTTTNFFDTVTSTDTTTNLATVTSTDTATIITPTLTLVTAV